MAVSVDVKVRQNGRIMSVEVIVAVGVNSDSRREVLGSPQGAQRQLAALPRPLHAQQAGACRQERAARRLRLHCHSVRPG
jgi:hypothetical protein